jgi:hypothetical protein
VDEADASAAPRRHPSQSIAIGNPVTAAGASPIDIGYGTAIGSHISGSQFARFGPNDPSLFRYAYPASFIGHSVFVKLPAFNIFGLEMQDIAGVSAHSYTLLGTGGLSTDVIAALASGIAQDWGIVSTSIAAQADLASIAAVTGYDINLGTPL